MILTIGLFLVSCSKSENDNLTANQFVAMLRAGSYDSQFLPDFKPDDIADLLNYANDYRIIEYFPVNPISSFRAPEFRLGECIMWTIESIRLHYDKTSEFAKFPSLVPQLIIPGGTIEPVVASADDLDRAYTLYLTWWSDNKNKDFEEFRNINPLNNSGLIWR